MAKQLNKVPIAGSVVKYDGLELVAERVGRPPEQDRDRDRHQDLLGGIRGGRSSRGGHPDSLRAGARLVSGAAVEKSLIPEDPEDLKLITLARATLARTGADQGACVRDTDGRAYAAASVHLEHLRLSAIAVAVAMAVSSGAGGIEAVALVGEQGRAPMTSRSSAICPVTA